MDYLPDETIMHVLGFVPDKMYVSIVCKKWVKLLDSLYKQQNKIDVNDPYHLKWGNISAGWINQRNYIEQIKNHNCLNYICHQLQHFESEKVFMCSKILKQNCVINNVSKPKDIHFLMKHIYDFSGVFNAIIGNNSYDMMLLFSFVHPIHSYWIKHASITTDINAIKQSIIKIVSLRIMTFENFYNEIYKHPSFKLKNEVLEYLEKHIDVKIAKMIKSYY